MPADKSYGWCKVHGVPDCTLEHPDVAELPKTPVVTQADLDRAARALAFAPRPANNPNCRTHLRRIQYVTAADADKSGIAVEPVWTAPAVEFVRRPRRDRVRPDEGGPTCRPGRPAPCGRCSSTSASR